MLLWQVVWLTSIMMLKNYLSRKKVLTFSFDDINIDFNDNDEDEDHDDDDDDDDFR